MTISAVIITCDEAEVIDDCLKSVASWVDEIVVLDMMSTDGTREICEKYAARVFDHERLTTCEPARNRAISLATGDWLLVLDPDERVPPLLAQRLSEIACQDAVDVVMVPFQTYVCGVPMVASGHQHEAHARFFRRNTLDWPATVHQVPTLDGWRVQHLPWKRELSMVHLTRRTIAGSVERLQRYCPREAEFLIEQGTRFSVSDAIRAGIRAWCRVFIKEKGYKDGVAGLWEAVFFAMYRFTSHMMLWERQGKPQALGGRTTMLWSAVGRLYDFSALLLRFSTKIRRGRSEGKHGRSD